MMKKVLVAALIAVLMLGTCMRLAAASPVPILGDDDEHESEEGNINAESVEPDEDDEELEDQESSDEDFGDEDENDEASEEGGDEETDDEEENESDDDEDGVDDDIEDAEERELSIEVSGSHAKVESEFENETMENEFEIEFKTEEGISIELEYKNETETGEEEIEAELEIEVQFLKIVEYFDNDTSGCLTENDEIVQTIYLKQLTYAPIEFTNIISQDGEAGYRFESVGILGYFEFNITAVLFPTYAIVDNTLVTPTETKITITITNFPYNDTTGASALALQINAVSEMEIEKETETTESEIKIESENATGYFNWENWAMVDNVNSTVNHSVAKTKEGTLINLCYPQGSNIVHDPKLGVGIKVPLITHIFTLITPELLIGTGITAIAITAAAIALTRGKKPFPAGITPFL